MKKIFLSCLLLSTAFYTYAQQFLVTSVSGGVITESGVVTVTNEAPDQVVVLNGGEGISVSGVYPDFTLVNTKPDNGVSVEYSIEGLQAVQSFERHLVKSGGGGIKSEIYATAKAAPEATHPLVRVHPVSGRKCLYVTEGYTARIVGLPEDESDALIAELAAQCIKPEFKHVHNWRKHDLVMWDDCATQHRATFDYPASAPRLMQIGRAHV